MRRFAFAASFALVFLTLFSSTAFATGFEIGALILGTYIAEATVIGTITLGSIVGTAVLLGATLGLSYLLSPSGGSLPKPADGHTALRQAIPPRAFVYGRVRLAGAYQLYEAKDGTSYDVLAVAAGPISAFVEHRLHDDVVTLDGSGFVSAAVPNDGRYLGGNVQIKTRLGIPTETAYAEVIAGLPTLWTAAHRGDGIASAELICKSVSSDKFQKVYPQGKPEYSAVIDGLLITDFRTGALAVSSNPVVQLVDYMTNADYGMGLDMAMFTPVLADLTAEANYCDVLVSKKNLDTEKRYASNGWAYFNSEPSQVIDAIKATCDGWIAERGDGTMVIRVGRYVAPTVIFTDAHIRGWQINYGMPDEQVINEIVPTFVQVGSGYKEVEGEPWRDAADISARGKVRSQPLSLTWVQSHAQARRLTKRYMQRIAQPVRGTLLTTLYGLTALGERYVKIQHPIISGLAEAVVEVTRVQMLLQQGRVAIDWVLVDPLTVDAWNPASEEGTEPPVTTKEGQTPPAAPSGLAVSVSGTGGQATLLLTFTPDASAPAARSKYAARYRVHDVGGGVAGLWNEEAPQSATIVGAGPAYSLTTGLVAVPQTYDVQVRAVADFGTASDWSTAVTIDTAIANATFDLDFVNGVYSVGTADAALSGTLDISAAGLLVDNDDIGIIGALLTALQGTAGSILVEVGQSSLTGQRNVIGGTSGATPIFFTAGGNQVAAFDDAGGGHFLIATLGSGNVGSTAGPHKVAFGWSPAGRSIVGNNGTLVTDAFAPGSRTSMWLGSAGGVSNFLGSRIRRVRVWQGQRLSDTTLKNFTV